MRFMTLDELSVGHSGVITAVGGEGVLRCRLLDMCLIPHTRVHVSKIAPIIRLPGEEEMRSLAEGALRVLRGQQEAGQY